MTRLPTIAATTTRPTTFRRVMPRLERDRLEGGRACERRQQHEHDDGEHVLDDEPADRDVPGAVCSWRLSESTRISTTVLATDSDRPKTIAAAQAQPKACAASAPSPVATALCSDGAGNGDAPHGQQFLEVELQADAEHQQDDADFGELLGEMRVGDEAGRVGTDDDAGEQVADDRRQAEPLRDVADDQRGAEAGRERQDEPGFRHVIDGSSPTPAVSRSGRFCTFPAGGHHMAEHVREHRSLLAAAEKRC